MHNKYKLSNNKLLLHNRYVETRTQHAGHSCLYYRKARHSYARRVVYSPRANYYPFKRIQSMCLFTLQIDVHTCHRICITNEKRSAQQYYLCIIFLLFLDCSESNPSWLRQTWSQITVFTARWLGSMKKSQENLTKCKN